MKYLKYLLKIKVYNMQLKRKNLKCATKFIDKKTLKNLRAMIEYYVV